jgi:hypothetical protein
MSLYRGLYFKYNFYLTSEERKVIGGRNSKIIYFCIKEDQTQLYDFVLVKIH